MINPEIGDFVISANKIHEIVWKGNIGLTTVYTVRLVSNPADCLDITVVNCDEIKNTMTLSHLRHLGEIVKKADAPKAIEVLFKNS